MVTLYTFRLDFMEKYDLDKIVKHIWDISWFYLWFHINERHVIFVLYTSVNGNWMDLKVVSSHCKIKKNLYEEKNNATKLIFFCFIWSKLNFKLVCIFSQSFVSLLFSNLFV